MPPCNALLALTLLLACLSLSQADSKPIMVIDLFRHGARAAYIDTWDTTKVWTKNLGELTNSGMRMHYLLGQKLAQDYPELLGDFEPSRLSIYSTDVNRTIMSAYSHLYGMFSKMKTPLDDHQKKIALPPGLEHINVSDYIQDNFSLPNGIQAVPVHIIGRERDYSIAADAGCKNFQSIWQGNLNSSKFQDFLNITKDTRTMIENYAKEYNITIPDLWNYGILADTLISNYYENLAPPVNVSYGSKEWNDLMFFNQWMVTYAYSGELKHLQLMSYNLFQRMFDQLNGKINGTFNKTWSILSAHDTTLLPILAGLGVTTVECMRDKYLGKNNDPQCVFPTFAATILTELYNDREKPYVKIKYDGVYVNPCNTSDNTCTIEDYQKLINQRLQGYTFDDWLVDCGISTKVDPTPDSNSNSSSNPDPNSNPNQNSESDNHTTILIATIAVGVVCIIELFVLVSMMRRKSKKSLDMQNDSSGLLQSA